VVAGWVLVLAALAVWSVRHDPPTVPEQQKLADAVPVLQRAAGSVVVAAQGPGRAVVIGALQISHGCRITPVRSGESASRSITVHVQADQARAVLDAIAASLPAGYRASAAHYNGGARVALHADAGHYVAIDADSPATAQAFSVVVSTGCRPDSVPTTADPAAVGSAPAALAAVLRVLRGGGEPVVRSVSCPTGGVASTYTVDNIALTGDLGAALQPVLGGVSVVRSDPGVWAYRSGNDAVVTTADGGRVQVSVTTGCL
jgi:hypothetical protein